MMSWSFNKSVALNFDEHVSQSVPFYKSFQNIAEIATMFIKIIVRFMTWVVLQEIQLLKY